MTTIVAVRATVECDGCGRHIIVDLDPGDSIDPGQDLADLAQEAVAGGTAFFEMRGFPAVKGVTSVQDGRCLCPDCTRAEDAKHPEKDPFTSTP